jgi:glycogen synthase
MLKKIKIAEYGHGLDDVPRYWTRDLVGTCNRVNVNMCNPKIDKIMPENCPARSLNRKKRVKKPERELGLSDNLNIPIFGVVSGFFHQKNWIFFAIFSDMSEKHGRPVCHIEIWR